MPQVRTDTSIVESLTNSCQCETVQYNSRKDIFDALLLYCSLFRTENTKARVYRHGITSRPTNRSHSPAKRARQAIAQHRLVAAFRYGGRLQRVWKSVGRIREPLRRPCKTCCRVWWCVASSPSFALQSLPNYTSRKCDAIVFYFRPE